MYEISEKNRPIVQKFGGTSVGSPERILAIAKRTAQLRAEGYEKIAIVVSAMSGETNRLIDLVRAIHPNPPAKAYDMTVAAGEQVSVGLMAAALDAENVEAEPLLGYQLGVVTDSDHARARIQHIHTGRIEQAWAKGRIPVLAGFQGVSPQDEITTLGRGGSDTSAVALAVALNASFCEINTDVSGVYTADPRLVKEASLIEKLDFDTAMELALLGGKILHVRCVELAAKYRMPLVVRSTFDPNGARRTKIMTYSAAEALEAPVVSAVSLEKNVVKITIAGMQRGEASLSLLFGELANAGVNVDIIVHDQKGDHEQMGFTIGEVDLSAARIALDLVKAKVSDFSYLIQEGLAKVSVVGLGMQTNAGVAARVFSSLAAGGAEVLMVSTSEIKISCVLRRAHAEPAMQALHRAFFPNQ